MSKQDALTKAKDFLENETQYRLGFITAEKPQSQNGEYGPGICRLHCRRLCAYCKAWTRI